MTRDVELIVFDCDGVLVDSEPLSCQIRAEWLTENGYAISAEEVARRFIGVSERDLRREIEAEIGRALPPDEHETRLKALMRGRLAPIPGIPPLIGALRAAGLRRCVASSASPEKLRLALELTGLWGDLAPHVFSTRLVARGKPAPDIFLYAAAALGVDPERCVVVEDSVAGIHGARAARMRTIGFCGGGHCLADHGERLRAAGASEICADAAALRRLLLGEQATMANA